MNPEENFIKFIILYICVMATFPVAFYIYRKFGRTVDEIKVVDPGLWEELGRPAAMIPFGSSGPLEGDLEAG